MRQGKLARYRKEVGHVVFMVACAAIMFLMMRGPGTRRGSAAEILKERYARGEIGEEEYEKRRRVLDS